MSINIHKKGFSLIEMAIGVFVLGLILLNFSDVVERIYEVDTQQEEQVNMKFLHESISTFISVNGFLPCPDTDEPPDGLENRVDGAVDPSIQVCDDREGYLPYNDFGVRSKDAWGNDYYYRVNARAENENYVNDICESASVLGREGTADRGELELCPDTNQFYCSNDCGSVCPSACEANIDPRPNLDPSDHTKDVAPYFYPVTPPFGRTPGLGSLKVYHESATPYDASVHPMGGGIVAVAISWGVNGKSVYRYSDARVSCDAGVATAAEFVNCTDSTGFVDIKTGENRDYITWATVNQAKFAIIGAGEYQ